MGEFNSDDYYIYYCGQESLRGIGVVFIVNKRVGNTVLGYNLKNDRMISVHFQGKPFNITVIMLNKLKFDGSWRPTRPSKTNTQKRCPFHCGILECKVKWALGSITTNKASGGDGIPLYRDSPSLAAKNIINLILVLTIWWCPCVKSFLVLLEEGVCYDQWVLLAKLC